MVILYNKDTFTCGVCKQLFTDPFVHRPCGISFDRKCIGKICPAPECGEVIAKCDLIPNYTLLKITDTCQPTIQMSLSYYLFLVDTSTSMWYSDSWLPFAIGKGRLTHAKQVLTEFFNQKCGDQLPATYLIILTDGGSNFGKEEAENVLWRTKELHISGHIIQIGDTNSIETRSMCDIIKYKFNYFKGGNATEFVNSFSDLIESETQARVANNSISSIDQLPSVPDTPIQIPSNQKQLA